VFGINVQALLSQATLGLVNGAFYAMLSLGLAVIFGMLNIVNFAHGALYMVGAFVTWGLLKLPGHQLLGGVGDRADRGRGVWCAAGKDVDQPAV